MKKEKYLHHNTEVTVVSDVKGKHREICLCYDCARFKPNSPDNCQIAKHVYTVDITYNLVTPVVECPGFVNVLPFEHLHEYVDEIAEALRVQLKIDEERWGDTWIKRGYEGQDERFKAWMAVKFKGNPVNMTTGWGDVGVRPDYLKIMGECLINLVREKYLG